MLQRLRYQVYRINSLIGFLSKKYTTNPIISPTPAFDEEGLKLFEATIAATSVYLEYGSGGSTLFASQKVQLLVSVDSDRAYSVAVADALGQSREGLRRELIYVDIGLAREWGHPVFSRPTKTRRERWKNYSWAPWEILERYEAQPDTILIDGRFRVACALQSFLNLQEGSACKILVDDYADRLEYKTIEKFGDLVEMHGRMALFHTKSRFDRAACRVALESYYSDPN